MKLITTIFSIALMFVFSISKAQTTAMDFNRADCNGNMQHLFTQLDSGHVAVLEFFMNNCSPCITAGNAIKPMYDGIAAQHAGKMHSYSIGYTNSYTCATIKNWVTSNGFNSIPMDSGAMQVAYYGGFGMPTIVIVAGTNHDILFTTIGFTTSDTAAMGTAIRNFFATTAEAMPLNVTSFKVFPNPASSSLNIELGLKEVATVSFELTNLAGQRVINLESEKAAPGTFTKMLSTEYLAEGMYILHANVNGIKASYKLNIIH